MPDSSCRECYDCGDKFTTFRRRHHCRICGQIFCSKCCNQELSGKIIGYKGTLGFVCCLFGWLVGFLTSSSTTRLYRGRASRQSVWQFYVLPHRRQRRETMTSVSACHIILTPTQPVGSGQPQLKSNPGPPHQESCALSSELPRPPGDWWEDN